MKRRRYGFNTWTTHDQDRTVWSGHKWLFELWTALSNWNIGYDLIHGTDAGTGRSRWEFRPYVTYTSGRRR